MVREWKLLVILSPVLLLIAGLLLNCGPQAPPTPTPTPKPVSFAKSKEITLTIGILEEPKTLYPAAVTSKVEQYMLDCLFLRLGEYDDQGEMTTDLVPLKRLPSEANRTLSIEGEGENAVMHVFWRFHPYLLWSDEEPVTTDDFEFTWKLWMNPDSGAPVGRSEELIAEVRSELDRVEVLYEKGFTDKDDPAIQQPFHSVLLPRHILEDMSPAEIPNSDYARLPIGNGPYLLEEWAPGESLTLKNNPNYHEAYKGKPYIGTVIFKIIPNADDMRAALEKGEIHLALGIDAPAPEKLEGYAPSPKGTETWNIEEWDLVQSKKE